MQISGLVSFVIKASRGQGAVFVAGPRAGKSPEKINPTPGMNNSWESSAKSRKGRVRALKIPKYSKRNEALKNRPPLFLKLNVCESTLEARQCCVLRRIIRCCYICLRLNLLRIFAPVPRNPAFSRLLPISRLFNSFIRHPRLHSPFEFYFDGRGTRTKATIANGSARIRTNENNGRNPPLFPNFRFAASKVTNSFF